MSLRSPKCFTLVKRSKVTTAPVNTPVDVSDVTEHLRLNSLDAAETTYVENLIQAATEEVQLYLRKSLITQTITASMDTFFNAPGGFPIWEGLVEGALTLGMQRTLDLPRSPVQSITAVRTYDLDNNASVYPATNYYLDNYSQNTYDRIVLNYDAIAPTQLRADNCTEIEYIAGYGDTKSTIPFAIRQGILQLIGYMYENRGDCGCGSGESPALHASGAAGLLRLHRIERMSV